MIFTIRFLAHAQLADESEIVNMICKSNGDVHAIHDSEYLILKSLLVSDNPETEDFAIFNPMIQFHGCK